MIASPLRPRHRQESGIAAAGQLAHRGTPYGASLSFATTTHLWPLPDPPSRKSRSATSRTGTARSIPGRALASSVLDSPLSGLQDRTYTSDLNIRTQHTRYASRLRRSAPRRRSLTACPGRTQPPVVHEMPRSGRPIPPLVRPRPAAESGSGTNDNDTHRHGTPIQKTPTTTHCCPIARQPTTPQPRQKA